MTDTTNDTNAHSTPSTTTDPYGTDPTASGRRYRQRGQTVREHRLTPRFTDEELSTIRAAADAARMTVTGFCAHAALAVARRQPGQPSRAGETSDDAAGIGAVGVGAEELAEMQRELFAARVAVNRTGTNLNQAVAQLNATGEAPVWLAYAVDRVAGAVQRVDALASRIHRRLA